jgi:DNA-binding response OmpR family regulator
MVKLICKRLLFVDDEPAIRKMLPVILRKYGFDVTVVATTKEALDAIQQHKFELLLCDLNIHSESDGYDAVRAMRQRNREAVVIILTGYPAMESAIEGIRLKVDDYIAKPSNADALVALLGDRLAHRQVPRPMDKGELTSTPDS